MKFIALLGRILFSCIFISGILHHFSSQSFSYASSAGVPMPSVLVPCAGIIAFLGGLSVLIGYKARAGAWLLVIFLVPVTLIMHNWWSVVDPMMRQMQHTMFMKNLTMLGGALLISYFGAGPYSIDSILAGRSK